MKTIARFKLYRDQGLFRDIGFLMLAAGFLLVKAFDQPLQSAIVYAPLVVFGIFAGLVSVAHVALLFLRLLDAIGERLGMGRGPRH
jgi:hypothetical protein